MKLYGGIDLHSNNSYVVLSDEADKIIYQKRLANDLEVILKELRPFKEAIQGLVVESTYNWYWLVDGLHSENYKVHLANTTYIQQYSGLKYTDDKHDAIWLAHLLRLGLLAEGYIYPKEQRGLRELLRRRQLMVREQTRHLLGLQNMLVRYENIKIGTTKIKTLSLTDKMKLASYAKDKNIQLAIKGQAAVLETVLKQIETLEIELKNQLHGNDSYKLLLSIPGVGKILAWLIVLETGNIHRFQQVGNYSSYCRCAESKRISNAKKKGENNRKNGSAYLGWAFIEASITAIQHYPEIKRYYQRKLNKSLRVVALKAVANKLARATYFILRDGVAFDMKKSFK